MTTQIYASAVFCSTRLDLKRLRQMAGDIRTPAWSAHVERAYRCAFSFCLNRFYDGAIRVEHLRSSRFDGGAHLGEVWSDWIAVSDRRLGTQSLHVSFRFPALRLQLLDADCLATQAVATFLKKIYQLSEGGQFPSGELAQLSRLLGETAGRRRNALGISRYIYTSLVCDEHTFQAALPESGTNVPERAASALSINLYRLLFQHALGVSAAVARAMLPSAWGSAAFFRLYSQPGGLLSIARPYPDGRAAAWFDPAPPGLANAPAGAMGADGQYPDYDLLPEYPPLRYLALPLLVYIAGYEETLRALHETAFGSHRLLRALTSWPPTQGLKSYRKRHLLASNLEGLRLPVLRDYVNLLLQRQLQERTTAAAMARLEMRETTRNLVLAVLAIVVTIVLDGDPAKLKVLIDDLTAIVHTPQRVPGPGR